MEDQIVSLETAKLAKEKGFNVPSFGLYCVECDENKNEDDSLVNYYEDDFYKLKNHNDEENQKGSHHMYSAPTQSMLQKWLREKHFVYVTALPSYTDNSDSKKCYFEIAHKRRLMQMGDIYSYFNTYEEALEAGLREALRLVNNKN